MSATFDPFGNADLDALDSVEDAVERAVRVAISIDDAAVERTIKIVDKSGIGPDLERWEAEDQKSLGGRPKPFSADTFLVVLLLAAWVHGRVNDSTICDVLYRQISDKMRAKLGVRTGNIGRHETTPDYYRRLNHRANSLLNGIDPSPMRKNRVVLKKDLPSRSRNLTPEQIAERIDRLESVVHRILYASYMSMPKSLRKKWKGGLAVDGTPIRQFTRGTKKASKWAPCDPDCAWYARSGDDDPAKHAKAAAGLPIANVGAGAARGADEKERTPNYKKVFFGMEATLAIMCGDDTGGTAYHPNLVLGMVMDEPGFRIGQNGTRVAAHVARRTGLNGWLAGDRAYSHAKPENFQLPTRALGYHHVFDYQKTELGRQATFGHAIQVEGRWYCDCMPEVLIEATRDYRAEPDAKNKIDRAAWQARLIRRRDHAMRVKELRPDGSMRLVSRCCPKKPSVTIPADGGAKFYQELEFGMPEHQSRYALMRNTNEGFNGTAKDGAYTGLDQPTRRRKRGIAAQSLLCAALLFAENMRRIISFEDKATADENGELAKKRLGRPKRRDLSEFLPSTTSAKALKKAPVPRYGEPPDG